MNDPSYVMKVDDINMEVYQAYEAKFGARMDVLEEQIRLLSDDIYDEFNDTRSANDLSFIILSRFMAFAMAAAYKRGVLLCPSKACVGVAYVIARQGFEVDGELVQPDEYDDFCAVALPLDPPAPGEPILPDEIMDTLPDWLAEHLRESQKKVSYRKGSRK